MSMNRDDNEEAGAGNVTAFERLVDTYGSNPARWPIERRGPAEALLKSSTQAGLDARRQLAQAGALDQLLDAPVPGDAVRIANLANRIVQTSCQSAQPKASHFGRQNVRPSLVAHAHVPRLPRAGWVASALLTASLLLGIFIGPIVSTFPAFHDVADVVGLGNFGDPLELSAFEDGGLQDEDVL